MGQDALFESGLRGTAEFDAEKIYRYTLTRAWNDGKDRLLFIMLNPSTATAEIFDPTVRRCYGWARDWDFGALEVCNLYALRSTDPKGLGLVSDPVGPENDAHIMEACGRAKVVI